MPLWYALLTKTSKKRLLAPNIKMLANSQKTSFAKFSLLFKIFREEILIFLTWETSSLIFETGRFNFLWRLSPPNLILLTRESLQSGEIFRSKHIIIIPSLSNLLFQKQNSQTNVSFYSSQICSTRNYMSRLGICQKKLYIYTTQFSGKRILHTENA